jgi:hypothetical protein
MYILTKYPFKLLDAKDSFGDEMVSLFNAAWSNASPVER